MHNYTYLRIDYAIHGLSSVNVLIDPCFVGLSMDYHTSHIAYMYQQHIQVYIHIHVHVHVHMHILFVESKLQYQRSHCI